MIALAAFGILVSAGIFCCLWALVNINRINGGDE